MRIRETSHEGWDGKRVRRLGAALCVTALCLGTAARSEVCNLKVVTDANPDYTDIGSMIHSITSNWTTDEEKCWALFCWNHIARRQTQPMQLHGMELTDPIRQFNDYGYTMCSTVSGVNCSIWGAMGLQVRFWDISMHTVCDVEYDGKYHMYDSSLSAIYTLCDGETIAAVPDIGADGACEASGGKTEPGHVAKYHCLCSTSANGWLTGADTNRSVAEEYRCFNPRGLKYRYYFNHWDLAHRYILNLRENELYTRYYHRMDADSPNAVKQTDKGSYTADPAYYVPNRGKDPESVNPRYRIRGNGVRTWEPGLTAEDLPKVLDSVNGLRAAAPAGLAPAKAGEPGEAVFRVEGGNVITSMTIVAGFLRRTANDVNAVSVSTTNGLKWKEVWRNDTTGETPADIKLIDEVNGAYEVLVKVELLGKAAPADARLKSIRFETITMLNSKTQPKLKLGKNTVCVGAGEQTGSVVLWPELQGDAYKEFAVEERNIASDRKHCGYTGVLYSTKAGEDAYVVFRVDVPGDMTRLTYGGRFYNRAAGSRTELHHSFDGGRTWTKSWSLTDTTPPWDVIHYEKADAPAGCRSALVKYLINTNYPKDTGHGCSIYAVRMEANHKPPDAAFRPIEVTFSWSERREDYSLAERSHTRLVEEVPFSYAVNTGGVDHPVVRSLNINLKGAVEDVKYGYSDGKDVGGERFQERWVSYGRNLAEGKPYTCTVQSGTNWGAGDSEGKKLTDGVVGAPYTGGTTFRAAALWTRGQKPVITVDLKRPEKCGAFRIQVAGYPWWDAMKGEIEDKVEVLASMDGKEYESQGFFDFDLRWKDLPANHIWPDDEKFCGHNFELIPREPAEARYVRFALTAARFMTCSEVQVLEFVKYEPFDLKIALPDGKDRSDMTRYLPKHTPSKPYRRR